MSIFVAWVVFPVVFGVVSLGCGLLLRQLAGRRLPGALLIPAGFALIVVAASFTTMTSATASLTTPIAVVLAVLGFGLSLDIRPRPDPWAIGAGLATFLVYAAPIVLSGSATFAGYVTLDDTATWLALADNALAHGRDYAALAPSSYSVVLADYVKSGYPLGAFLPLGIGHQLTGQDTAWLFQPQIAVLGSMLSLSIYSLTAPLVRRRPLRAATAFLGSQAALLFGYAFWSGIKEMTAAALMALVGALVARLVAEGTSRGRALVPLAAAAAAMLDTLAIVGVVWLGAIAVLAVALVLRERTRRMVLALVALVAGALILAVPALAAAADFLAGAGEITSGSAIGNLIHPLSKLQLFGIWPTGDFRTRPADMGVTYVLIAVLVVVAAAGFAFALRRRAWGVPLFVATALAGCLTVIALGALGRGSPWLDGKALATASPALVAAGAAGAAALFESGRRVEAIVAAAAIAGGVLWSNGLRYANVWLAPRGQLAELQTIGNEFAGDGPTLMTEYQPYGVRHFLRALDPEAASERRARFVSLRSGGTLNKGEYADLDAFQLGQILVYRTLVLRTSPVESRPPSVYRLVWSGRFYEVWQRPEPPQRILEHLPLGSPQQPVGTAACTDVRRLAALAARDGGQLVAAERAPAEIADLAASAHPASWHAASNTLVPDGAGAIETTLRVASGGSYGFWLGGSFRGKVRIEVDGRTVGSASDQLEESEQLAPLGTAALTVGTHRVQLRYRRSRLRPGDGSYQFGLGPLAVGRTAGASRLVVVPPADGRSLCRKRFDWIEAVAP